MTTDDETCAGDLTSLLEGLSKLELEQLARENDDGSPDNDDLFVTLLQLVDDYEHLTRDMCEELKKGYLDVAKTNYDNFMAASTFNSRISRFSYDERPQSAQITVSHSSDVFTIHRKEEEKGSKTDPIRMFGLMPPYTLRTAQGHFVVAVSKMVELANVKSRLAALENKIMPVQKDDSSATLEDIHPPTEEDVTSCVAEKK